MAEHQKYHVTHLNLVSFENTPPHQVICFLLQIPGHWVWPVVTFPTVGRLGTASLQRDCLLRGGPSEPARLCDPCRS